MKTYSSGVSGLTLLAGLGAFVGIAYALTRKEASATPPPPKTLPAPMPPPQPPPSVITFTSAPAPATIQAPLPTLDRALTPQEAEAVLFALSRETDPNKLLGFAASWGTSAPLTTALLISKAQLLSGGLGS